MQNIDAGGCICLYSVNFIFPIGYVVCMYQLAMLSIAKNKN